MKYVYVVFVKCAHIIYRYHIYLCKLFGVSFLSRSNSTFVVIRVLID